MRLTRNTTPDGKCKYAIVRLDKLRKLPGESEMEKACARALDDLAAFGILEYGQPGSEEECFVLKLKDENTAEALYTYAEESERSDTEFAKDVRELAERSYKHPLRKRPD